VTPSTPKDPPSGTRLEWLSDKVLRGVIWTLLRLPLKTRLAVMSWLFRHILAGPAGYRARALANLAHVWPEKSEEERQAITEAALDNAARTMIELFDLPSLRDRMAKVTPEGPGVDAIEAARAEGRAILFLTGHFGNFDAPRVCMVARGLEIGGLYRALSNPYFNAYYSKAISAVSGPAFEQGRRGTINLVRHLKGGGASLLLFDVYDSGGVAIPFLGQPAPTLTSAAEIALKTNALVVPYFGLRNPDGVSFRAIFEAPIPNTTPEEMTRALSARLEARIEDTPGQWIWIHRRWKPKRQLKRSKKAAKANSVSSKSDGQPPG